MRDSFSNRVYQYLEAYPHPHKTELTRVLTSKTSLSTSGFPYISQSSFELFLQEIPHLFVYGRDLLNWLAHLEEGLQHSNPFQKSEVTSLQKAIFVLRNVVYSASICAPSDHWILKHILSVHAKIGLVHIFQDGGYLDREELADKLGLARRHLGWDLSFLHSRGYLRSRGSRYALAQCFQASDIFLQAKPLQEKFLTDMVDPIVKVLSGNASGTERDLVREFYDYPETQHIPKSWQADHFQIGIGYRLVPSVLALHVLKITSTIKAGAKLPDLFPEMERLFTDAGILQGDSVTSLGARVLSRGPGPFGIIHA